MSPRFGYVDPDSPQPTRLSRAALKRVLGWLRPYRTAILFNICLSMVLTGVELWVPQLLRGMIDGVIEAVKQVGSAANEAQVRVIREAAANDLLLTVGGFVGLFVFGTLVRFLEVRRTVAVAQRFMYGLRERFFRHLHRLSLRYYDKMKAGQIIARGTSDLDAIHGAVEWAPNHITSSVFMVLGAAAMLLYTDPVLFAVVFPILPVLYFLTKRFRARATTAYRELRAQTGRLTANVAESIAGARVIQAFAREQKNMEIFGSLTNELYGTRVETARVQGRYMAGMRSVWTWARVMVILVGAWRVAATAHLVEVDARVTAGELVAFLAYVGMFFRPMDMLSNLYNQLLHATAAADRVIEVLDTEPQIVDRPNAASPRDFDGEIEFDRVTFEYTPGLTVLEDVSFRVRPGEVIALVGPTGAGKTTICRLIARFYEAQQGEVRIDDLDVRAVTQAALHRRMGIVLQENFLFTGTVADNIRYGRPEASDEEVIECAKQIGSHQAIEVLPKGYETEVGERGESLSAGQRQLICFTRAMLADPRILILDEATSSVDTQTELRVQEALRRLTEQRTCFIVAHRLSTVYRADRVMVVEGGRITEQGTHVQLMEHGGRYAAMYEEFIRAD